MVVVITLDRKKRKVIQQLFPISICEIFEISRDFHFKILLGAEMAFSPEMQRRKIPKFALLNKRGLKKNACV